MGRQINQDLARERQQQLLRRPHAKRVVQVLAEYLRASVPDPASRLGTSMGFTVMTPLLVARGEKVPPGQKTLATINIAMSFLIYVRDLPDPSFHFCVFESAGSQHAVEQLAWLGHSVEALTTTLKGPTKREIRLDGIEAAEAGLQIPALCSAIGEITRFYESRNLLNQGWHNPFAAPLLVEALADIS